MYEEDVKRQMETINNKIFELIKENVSNKRIAERYAKRYLKIMAASIFMTVFQNALRNSISL